MNHRTAISGAFASLFFILWMLCPSHGQSIGSQSSSKICYIDHQRDDQDITCTQSAPVARIYQLGSQDQDRSRIVQIQSSDAIACWLRESGAYNCTCVYQASRSDWCLVNGQWNATILHPEPNQLKPLHSLVVGAEHVCAWQTTTAGSSERMNVICMGSPQNTGAHVPPTVKTLVSTTTTTTTTTWPWLLAAGRRFTCLIHRYNASALCWGTYLVTNDPFPPNIAVSGTTTAMPLFPLLGWDSISSVWPFWSTKAKTYKYPGDEIVSVSCGHSACCIVTLWGYLGCWGNVASLGIPTSILLISSAAPQGYQSIVLAVDRPRACAIRSITHVAECWSLVNTGSQNSVPSSDIWKLASSNSATPPLHLLQLALGDGFTCGLRHSMATEQAAFANLVCWGTFSFVVPTLQMIPRSLSLPSLHACGLVSIGPTATTTTTTTTSNSIVCWGANSRREAEPIPWFMGFRYRNDSNPWQTTLAYASLAESNATAMTFRTVVNRPTTVNNHTMSTTTILSTCAGTEFACAVLRVFDSIKQNTTMVVCWGNTDALRLNAFSSSSSWSDTLFPQNLHTTTTAANDNDDDWDQVACGNGYVCMKTRVHGQMYCTGTDVDVQLPIVWPPPSSTTRFPSDAFTSNDSTSTTTSIVSLSALYWLTCVVFQTQQQQQTNDIACWGHVCTDGQCSPPSPSSLQMSSRGEMWDSVSAGKYFACGITRWANQSNALEPASKNRLICWGRTNLASATTNTWLRAASRERAWIAVSVAYTHACALRRNGTILCWTTQGSPRGPEVTGPSQTKMLTAGLSSLVYTSVTCGLGRTCAIEKTLGVRCWSATGSAATDVVTLTIPAAFVGGLAPSWSYRDQGGRLLRSCRPGTAAFMLPNDFRADTALPFSDTADATTAVAWSQWYQNQQGNPMLLTIPWLMLSYGNNHTGNFNLSQTLLTRGIWSTSQTIGVRGALNAMCSSACLPGSVDEPMDDDQDEEDKDGDRLWISQTITTTQGGTGITTTIPVASKRPRGSITMDGKCRTACAAGHFCPRASSDHDACPAGRFGLVEQQTQPECSGPCPSGFYCPLATQFPSQWPCPAGRYSQSQASNASCTDVCAAGFWCPAASTNARAFACTSNATFCRVESSQPALVQDGYRVVTQRVWLESSHTWLTVSVDQTPCTAGSWCVAGMQRACVPGQFSVRSGVSQCDDCLPGRFTATIGTATNCSACPMGTIQVFPGQTTCQACSPGTFEIDSTLPCAACEPGRFTATSGTSSNCVTCPVGKVQLLSGQTRCQACSPGSYWVNATLACVACARGRFGREEAANSSLTCRVCPAGTFNVRFGSTSCEYCSVGRFSSSNEQTNCTACPTGRFASLIGQTACTACANGTYQPLLGSSICLTCLAGHYRNDDAQEEQEQQEQQGGNQASMCWPCPLGTYQSQIGQSSCINCVGNAFTDAPASRQCKLCLDYTFAAPLNHTGCFQPQCNRGYELVAAQTSLFSSSLYSCQLCLPGRYSKALVSNGGGDDTTTSSNRRVCQACSIDTYSPFAAMSNTWTCPVGVNGVQCDQGILRVLPGYWATFLELPVDTVINANTTWFDIQRVLNGTDGRLVAGGGGSGGSGEPNHSEDQVTFTLVVWPCLGSDDSSTNNAGTTIQACMGGHLGDTCGPDRIPTSPMCSRCAWPLVAWNGACVDCSSLTSSTSSTSMANRAGLVMALICLLSLYLGFLHRMYRKSPGDWTIVISFVQSSIVAIGPFASQQWLKALWMPLTLDVNNVSATSCFFASLSVYNKMTLMFALGFACIGFYILVGFIHMTSLIVYTRQATAVAATVLLRYVRSILGLVLLLYFPIITLCLRWFHCVAVGSDGQETVVLTQPTVSCESSEYQTWAAGFKAILALYGILFPMCIVVLLAPWSPLHMHILRKCSTTSTAKQVRGTHEQSPPPEQQQQQQSSFDLESATSSSEMSVETTTSTIEMTPNPLNLHLHSANGQQQEGIPAPLPSQTTATLAPPTISQPPLPQPTLPMAWTLLTGLFADPFCPRYSYWQAVNLLQRGVLIILDVRFFEPTSERFVYMTFVFFISLGLDSWFRPYRLERHRIMQHTSLVLLGICSLLMAAEPHDFNPAQHTAHALVVFLVTTPVFLWLMIKITHFCLRRCCASSMLLRRPTVLASPRGASSLSSRSHLRSCWRRTLSRLRIACWKLVFRDDEEFDAPDQMNMNDSSPHQHQHQHQQEDEEMIDEVPIPPMDNKLDELAYD
jgi:hypothetical protein